MRRPASRNCQPTSRTSPSAVIPATASSPSSTLSSAGRSPAVAVLPRDDPEVERVPAVRPAAGLVALVAQRPLDAGERAERVGGELVAHRGGRGGEPADRARDRPRGARVEDEVAERRRRPLRGGERGDEHVERPAARGGRALVEVVPAVDDDAQHAAGVLGALGVAAHPVQVLGGARRDAGRRAARRRGLARGRLVGRHPRLDRRVRLRGEHPHVLGGGAEGRRDDVPRRDAREPAGHHRVRPAVRDRVRPQHGGARPEVGGPDALRGRQVAADADGRRRRPSGRPGPPAPGPPTATARR